MSFHENVFNTHQTSTDICTLSTLISVVNDIYGIFSHKLKYLDRSDGNHVVHTLLTEMLPVKNWYFFFVDYILFKNPCSSKNDQKCK